MLSGFLLGITAAFGTSTLLVALLTVISTSEVPAEF